jgi:tetratricopeptide (TPR) repeat protein
LKQYDRASEVGNKLLNLGYADEESKIEAQFYIAKSNLELNQLDQALASFEQVYKQNKTEIGAESMYQVAYINFLKEKYKESQDLIMKLKDDFSYYDYWKAKAFILLADISLKTGDIFTAKNTLQSIVDNYEKDDDVRQTAKDKLNQIKENEKQAPK